MPTPLRYSLFAIACVFAIGLAAPGAKAQDDATAERSVVIVTGIDHPAHDPEETAPVLQAILQADSRLTVDIEWSPDFLGTDELHDYDLVVMHWMNWDDPGPGDEALANLERFVLDGGGMTVIHFACGAFHGAGEERFLKIAGRIWDPALPAHDPYQPFTVRVTDTEHPVTQGMESFETIDELYTCLTGQPHQPAVEVLATARSSELNEDHPMAFVLEPGDGRVFHTPLGHDVQAMQAEGFRELVHRGTAWALGLEAIEAE